MQHDADSQIRLNSPFGGMAPALEQVVRSFARTAPADSILVVKEHPLDPQLTDWQDLVSTEATRLGVQDRVIYIAGGDIGALVQGSRGVVTVNSTVGILALSRGIPVATLARSIYDLAGLTFQLGLDRFWREGAAPDPTLYDAFRRVVAHRTQINGGFFSALGLSLAVQGAVLRLEGSRRDLAVTATSPETAFETLAGGALSSPSEAD
jgi:capsular polysaccharide export protein